MIERGEWSVATSCFVTGAAAGFRGPGGLALDTTGHLLVSDTYNYAIRDVTISSGAVTTP